ncbi:MAG: hypothetical protein NC095_01750 [Muribaculum sp.]|nr:hypothetical protein [Muribaculum sp.]
MEDKVFFKVSKSEIAGYILGSVSKSWILWLVALIGCLLSVGGFFIDWRLLVMGLMALFTIVPSIGFFIFYSCILDSHIVANMLPHTVEPHPEGYLVRIFRKKMNDEDDQNDEIEWIESQSMTILDSNVVRRKDKGDFSILHLVDSPVRLLYIPRGM